MVTVSTKLDNGRYIPVAADTGASWWRLQLMAIPKIEISVEIPAD